MKTGMAHVSLLLLVSAGGCAGRGARLGSLAGNRGAAADLTGRWNVTVLLGAETIPGLALLTQSGDSVKGSMGPNEDNQHPLEGIVQGGRVTVTMRPRPGRTTAFDKVYLTVDGDTLSGTTEGGRADKGVIRLVRLRK
jgi:hypothetical protein